MQVRLSSSTDSALHVIFDPQVLAEHPPKGSRTPAGVHTRGGIARTPSSEDDHGYLARLVAARQVLTYNDASDGSVRILALVDEAPSDDLLDRSYGGQERALLYVPSGRLVACGAEYLRPARGQTSGEGWALDFAHMGSEAHIPPGRYACDSFSVHFTKKEADARWKRAMEPAQRRLVRISEGMLSLGFFCEVAAIVSTFVLLAGSVRYATASGLALAALGVFLIASSFQFRKRPDVAEALRKKQELLPPEFVLVLRRLADDADTSGYTAGELGPAETGDWGPVKRP